MNYTSSGIIIQFIQASKHKIALLDYHRGHINGITALSNLSIGALISYTIRTTQSTYFIENIQLLYLPLPLAQTDILFLHHILELIYYFSPVESCNTDIFTLIQSLYTTYNCTMQRNTKKLFVLKLFTTLNIIPELSEIRTTEINRLSLAHIDQLYTENIDTPTEKKLDRWLWYCIYQHPYANKFKTTHFLDETRMP